MKQINKVLLIMTILSLLLLTACGTPKEETQEFKDLVGLISSEETVLNNFNTFARVGDTIEANKYLMQAKSNLQSIKDQVSVLKKDYNVSREETIILIYENQILSAQARLNILSKSKDITASDLLFNKEQLRTKLISIKGDLDVAISQTTKIIWIIGDLSVDDKNYYKQHFDFNMNDFKVAQESVLSALMESQEADLNLLKIVNK